VGDIENRITKAEHEIELMRKDCDQMLSTISHSHKMLTEYGEKYTKFLDELIEEKADQKEMRKMIRDKLAVGITWATVSFIFLSVVHYSKSWIKL